MVSFVLVVVAVERDKVYVHYGKSRHNEAAQRSHVTGRINGIKHRNNKIFQIGITDDDLGISCATDHARVARAYWNHLNSLFQIVGIATPLVGGPLAEAVNSIS
jgi:hypothetical protein